MGARPWQTMWCDLCMCWDSVGGGGSTVAEAEANAAAAGWQVSGNGANRKWRCPLHLGGSPCPHDGTDSGVAPGASFVQRRTP